MGDSNAELVNLDRLDPAVGIAIGKTVGGMVAEAVQVSQVERVYMGWISGYEYWWR